jgi:voltage-gated potassium channel
MHALRLRLKIVLALLLGIIGIGTLGFVIIEKMSWFNALYFTIVTVATVGYGDIAVHTLAGRILALFIIITGVGTFLVFAAQAAELMLSQHEWQMRREKVHMVISLFFTEVGIKLLNFCVQADEGNVVSQESLQISDQWSKSDFASAKTQLSDFAYTINPHKFPHQKMALFLKQERDFLLRLLENPSLLEKESFTELLRSVFHLADELLQRPDFTTLPEKDLIHLAGDLRRVYVQLLPQWLDYIAYLQNNYPYLFSFVIRLNPFNPKASVIIQ